jgi:hypothetical protein
MAPRVLHDDGGSQPLTEARRHQQGFDSPDSCPSIGPKHSSDGQDPLLTPIKGRSRALVREGWPRGRMGRRIRLSLSLSPTRTLVTPYCKRIHPPWAQDNTKAAGFPLLFSPFVSRLAPTHLGWDTQRQFTRRSRDPPGSKRRHPLSLGYHL